MNKPAPKEPSMDEILSSIRQIIADDDAAVAPARPATPAAANAAPAPRPFPTAAMPPKLEPPQPLPSADEPAPEAAPEPLALTPEQIVVAPEMESAADSGIIDQADAAGMDDDLDPGPANFGALDGEPELVDPDDIAFVPDVEADETPSLSVPVEEAFTPPPSPPPPIASARRPAAAARPPPSAPSRPGCRRCRACPGPRSRCRPR